MPDLVDGDALADDIEDALPDLAAASEWAEQIRTLGFYAHQAASAGETIERLRNALLPFAHPRATTRKGSSSKPEADVMTVEITAGDWIRACVALGSMDVEYLRSLPVNAQPSDEFIDSLR